MTMRAGAKETILVLDEEIARRILAAARLVGMDPEEFIVKAVQHRCAEVLGETTEVDPSAAGATGSHAVLPGAGEADQPGMATGLQTGGPWAIRPMPSRVLRAVADASHLSIETIAGPGRGRATARARAVAAFLLRNDAGQSIQETARVLNRSAGTVARLTSSMDQAIGLAGPQDHLLASARRRLKNGISVGKQYPPLPYGTATVKLLPGLLACRLALGLTQPELARRAGIARETLARLERLRRRARLETLEVLTRALGVSERSLTTGTEELPVSLRPQQNNVR